MVDPNSTPTTPSLAEIQAIVGLLKIVIAALFVAVSTIVMGTWRAAKARADETEKMRRGEAAYREVFGSPEDGKIGLRQELIQVKDGLTENGKRLRGLMGGLNSHGSQPEIIAQQVGRTLKETFARMEETTDHNRRALIQEQEALFDRREEDRKNPYDTMDEPDPFPTPLVLPPKPPKRRI